MSYLSQLWTLLRPTDCRYWLLWISLAASHAAADSDLKTRIKGLETINRPCSELLEKSILSGKVVLPLNARTHVGVAVGNTRGLRPVLHGRRLYTPGEMVRHVMGASPSLRDNLIIEALEKIESPTDPSRLGIFCFSQHCSLGISEGGASGMLLSRLFHFVTSEPVLQKPDWALKKFREINFQSIKLGNFYNTAVESRVPFDKAKYFQFYIQGRNDIPDKLKISEENWFSRVREIRATMQETVGRAGLAPLVPP